MTRGGGGISSMFAVAHRDRVEGRGTKSGALGDVEVPSAPVAWTGIQT